MLVAIAYAAEESGFPVPGLGPFVPFILIFAIFYFLLIRPQQKKAKAHRLSIDAMKAGDYVVTNGGMFGTVVKIDGDRAVVEIADKVKVTILKDQLNLQSKQESNSKSDSKSDSKKKKK